MRLVNSARDNGSMPTIAPSSGLGVTGCAMPPRTALDASVPPAPVRWGDGVLVARAFLALACFGCAIRHLLESKAAAGGAQVCDCHSPRIASPHALDGRAAGRARAVCREHSTKVSPPRQGGGPNRPLV